MDILNILYLLPLSNKDILRLYEYELSLKKKTILTIYIKKLLKKNKNNIWDTIQTSYLSEKFIKKHKKRLNLKYIILSQRLSENFIINNIDIDYISDVIKYQKNLTLDFINKYINLVNLDLVLLYQKVPEYFIINNINKFSKKIISQYKYLSEDFLEKYNDYIIWKIICKNQKLSERFIIKYIDKFYIKDIIRYQKLSQYFINIYCTNEYLDDLVIYQELSNEFIINNIKSLDLYNISIYQKNLSLEFIELYINELDLKYIVKNISLNENFLTKYINIPIVNILKYQKINLNFITIYSRKITNFISNPRELKMFWINISKLNFLDEKYLDEFQDYVNWILISKYLKLSQYLINKFITRLEPCLENLFIYQELEKEFILKYKNKIDIEIILKYQKIDEDLKYLLL